VVFECLGFSDVVLDLVCSAILPSNWLAEPCPNDVKELVSTGLLLLTYFLVHINCFGFCIIFLVSFSLF